MKINFDQVVSIDFETYYDQHYSLRSKAYNTSSYIRDPQFQIHCCAVKFGRKKSRCYPRDQAIKILQDIDWTQHDLLAHNVAFDGLICSHHLGIVPRRYFDTLAMTRGLHAEVSRADLDTIAKFYGIGAKTEGLVNTKGQRDLDKDTLRDLMSYCNNDNELCFSVFEKQIEVFPEKEVALIDLTASMFCDPVLQVDIPRAERALQYETNERLRFIAISGYSEKELNSSSQLAAALRKLGVEPPTKISPYNGEVGYAFAQTDHDFIELQQHEDIRVVRLIQGRLAAKSTLKETRAMRLMDAGAGSLQLPVMLNYYGAKTGRWSGGNKMNMQNLPRPKYENKQYVEGSGELRGSVIAPPGHQIVVGDSAQIEARVLGWLAGDEDLLHLFATDQDVYSYTAEGIYNRPVNKNDDPEERFVGKIARLGLGYGMGGKKFQTTLALGIMGPPVEISLNDATRAVTRYRKTNPLVPALWKRAEDILLDMVRGKSGSYKCLEWEGNSVWLPNGMGLHYPGLALEWDAEKNRASGYTYISFGKHKKIYGGLLVENIVQALARIIVADQMLVVAERIRVASMAHDEIVGVSPTKHAKADLKFMLDQLRVPPEWAPDLPLGSEGGFAPNYLDAK